jgi:hypothetical protein
VDSKAVEEVGKGKPGEGFGGEINSQRKDYNAYMREYMREWRARKK